MPEEAPPTVRAGLVTACGRVVVVESSWLLASSFVSPSFVEHAGRHRGGRGPVRRSRSRRCTNLVVRVTELFVVRVTELFTTSSTRPVGVGVVGRDPWIPVGPGADGDRRSPIV